MTEIKEMLSSGIRNFIALDPPILADRPETFERDQCCNSPSSDRGGHRSRMIHISSKPEFLSEYGLEYYPAENVFLRTGGYCPSGPIYDIGNEMVRCRAKEIGVKIAVFSLKFLCLVVRILSSAVVCSYGGTSEMVVCSEKSKTTIRERYQNPGENHSCP